MKRLIAIMGALLVTGVLLYASSCGDKSTGPEPEPEPEKDYRVWYWDAGDVKKLHAYRTATHEIDSSEIPWGMMNLAVSHDGRRLYMTMRDSAVVIDTDSLKQIAHLPHGSHWESPAISPCGRFVAILGNHTVVLRASDYSVVRVDSTLSTFAYFSSDGNRLYGAADSIWIMPLDNLEAPIVRKQFAHGRPTEILPTPDESKWLMYMMLQGPWVYSFEVYDVASDSIIFREILSPGGGNLAMSPDGRYAFYGNPGTMQQGPEPDEANAIEEIVDTKYISDEMTWNFFPVGPILVTPDGQKLFAMPGISNPLMLLYDLDSHKFLDYRELGWNKYNVGPTFQTQP